MIRFALACLIALLPAAASAEQCDGRDLYAALDPPVRASIDSSIDATPFGRGNYWRATRGTEVAHIVGTYHFADPRHAATLARIGADLDAAETLLVEAGPEEMKLLKDEMAARPDRLFAATGPTLPERMAEEDWQKLSAAMVARGVPPFLASKMRAWYVSMMLAVPPCAMATLTKGAEGLDASIMTRAAEAGIPIAALEPYDTVFKIFDSLTAAEEIDLIRSTLALGDQAEDYSETLANAYFAEDARVSWELGLYHAYSTPGLSPAAVTDQYARLSQVMLTDRNRAWIPRIEAATARGPAFVAVGALHLSGEDGVLALLEKAGFTIERRPFK